MRYACLIEKLNLMTEIYCDPMIRCPEFEKAYVRFYRVSLKLSPELFKKEFNNERVIETKDAICKCAPKVTGKSRDFSIFAEVPKSLEQYFTKVCTSYQNYLAQKTL